MTVGKYGVMAIFVLNKISWYFEFDLDLLSFVSVYYLVISEFFSS